MTLWSGIRVDDSIDESSCYLRLRVSAELVEFLTMTEQLKRTVSEPM